jgi:hypothetical protein
VCARETWFETPLCDDATGGPLLDELVCVECGTAVLVAAPAPVLTPTRAPSHHAA